MDIREWEKVGKIGVDAGICWIGDPCYTVTPDAKTPAAQTWPEFCDLLEKGESDGTMQWNYAMGHAGLGVSVSTGYGDGVYSVYVQRNKYGRVMRAMVDFEGLDPDEEEVDN
jgi:hypothetical protein